MIVVVDICYWLHPVVNPRMRRGVTELKSEKINRRVKVFFFCSCVQIYEFQYYTLPVGYLSLVFDKTIIPRTRVGYELLDSGRGAEHRVGYHKLISNKREWNNCFIKYQTLDKYILSFNFYRLEFSAIFGKIFRYKIVSFHIWTNYRI